MWSDNEVTLDLLNVGHLITAVTRTITNPRLLPTTIGIFGDWGSGKSSLVQMVHAELAKDPDTLCIVFNGWLFEGYDDAKAALMGTILDELRDKRGAATKAGALFTRLVKKVDWLRLVGLAAKGYVRIKAAVATGGGSEAALALVKDASEGDPEEIQKVIKEGAEGTESGRQTVRDFQKEFQELLEKTGVKRLVVFIDDLDRCLPDRVIETLEAIKLFLFVPRSAFIISADEDLIQHAVRMRFPSIEGVKEAVGRDYLEKLIQLPIRVPPLSAAETESYMNLLFTQLRTGEEAFKGLCERWRTQAPTLLDDVAFSYGTAQQLLGTVPTEVEEDLALVAQIAQILAQGMEGNPRQTKRFLNMLLLRVDIAQTRGVQLERRVLAKLMLLEYFRTEAFATLGEWQSHQGGTPIEIDRLEAWLREDTPPDAEAQDDTTGTAPVTAPPAPARPGMKIAPRAPAAPPPERVTVPAHAEAWTGDPWLVRWLGIQPALAGKDLRPYFYFARDRTVAHAAPAQRLSPKAREVLVRLQASSKAMRLVGRNAAADLSDAEAAAVFATLADQARRAEDLGREESPLMALALLVEARPTLATEFVTALGRIPHAAVPGKSAMQLVRLTQGTPAATSAHTLLGIWAKSNNRGLAQAATSAQARLSGARPAPPGSHGPTQR